MSDNNAPTPQMPQPDPLLSSLDPMVGTWQLHGRTAGATEDNLQGTAVIRKLPGGFFFEQTTEIDFAGMVHVKGIELIGYEAETKSLASQVYSNMAPVPVGYHWKLDGKKLTITMDAGATMQATMSDDGQSFEGEWKPDPGHENDPGMMAYSFGGTRLR